MLAANFGICSNSNTQHERECCAYLVKVEMRSKQVPKFQKILKRSV